MGFVLSTFVSPVGGDFQRTWRSNISSLRCCLVLARCFRWLALRRRFTIELVLSRFDIVLLAKVITSMIYSFVFLINLLFDCGERWVAIFLAAVLSTGKESFGVVDIVSNYLFSYVRKRRKCYIYYFLRLNQNIFLEKVIILKLNNILTNILY